MFFEIGVLKNFAIFTGIQAYNFIKKILQHRYFAVNIAKFLRTAFYTRTPPVVVLTDGVFYRCSIKHLGKDLFSNKLQ